MKYILSIPATYWSTFSLNAASPHTFLKWLVMGQNSQQIRGSAHSKSLQSSFLYIPDICFELRQVAYTMPYVPKLHELLPSDWPISYLSDCSVGARRRGPNKERTQSCLALSTADLDVSSRPAGTNCPLCHHHFTLRRKSQTPSSPLPKPLLNPWFLCQHFSFFCASSTRVPPVELKEDWSP